MPNPDYRSQTEKHHREVVCEPFVDHSARKQLAGQVLMGATVVESDQMLPEVITMNSTFNLFNLDRRESDTYTLVYPEEASIEEGKLSILSPLEAGSENFLCRHGRKTNFPAGRWPTAPTLRQRRRRTVHRR